MQRLKEKIEGKTCFVLLGGASLEYLRIVAQDFKDKDICWCGMNFFTPAKTHILDSIGKKYGVCRERIRQIEVAGFKKISKKSNDYDNLFKYFKTYLKNNDMTYIGTFDEVFKPII